MQSASQAEEEDPQIYEKIFRTFKEKNVTAFVYIGGNDSMDTVNKLHQYATHHSIPEVPFSKEAFVNDVKEQFEAGGG